MAASICVAFSSSGPSETSIATDYLDSSVSSQASMTKDLYLINNGSVTLENLELYIANGSPEVMTASSSFNSEQASVLVQRTGSDYTSVRGLWNGARFNFLPNNSSPALKLTVGSSVPLKLYVRHSNSYQEGNRYWFTLGLSATYT